MERDKAIEILKEFHKHLVQRDTYWNVTEDCKEAAKISIDLISDGSEYWQKVKIEIDKLPEYIEDAK
jgi:hypothetical protein